MKTSDSFLFKFFEARAEHLSQILVFLSVTFFLTIKSWTTASLFLLAFISVWSILKNPKYYFSARHPIFWQGLVCLLIPFSAEFLLQVVRQSIDGPNLDGPSRVFLATFVFVYFSRLNCRALVNALSSGAAAGIITVGLSLIIFPEQYWGARAATYFVDPITLPSYLAALLGVFLFVGFPWASVRVNLLFKLVATLITLLVAIDSASRSSWIALALLMFCYFLFAFRGSLGKQIGGVLLVMFLCLTAYVINDSVQSRIDLALNVFLSFSSPSSEYQLKMLQTTSTGHRLLLALIDWELITRAPFLGVEDYAIPPFGELVGKYPVITEKIYEIKLLAGSHSEFLAQIVRKGIIFGGLIVMSLFVFPAVLVSKATRFNPVASSDAMKIIRGLTIPIFAAALTIQVFNLKMTITFYALVLALAFAKACNEVEIKKGNSC